MIIWWKYLGQLVCVTVAYSKGRRTIKDTSIILSEEKSSPPWDFNETLIELKDWGVKLPIVNAKV